MQHSANALRHPVMPSGPAFVDARALSPDPAAILQAERAGLSAEEFLAQIASTPEYQASKYFESNAFDAADEEIAEETMETNSSATASLVQIHWLPRHQLLLDRAFQGSFFESQEGSSNASHPGIFAGYSNSSTLPGSAEARRRRSLTTTINQRSPLSASPSNFSNGDILTPRKTPPQPHLDQMIANTTQNPITLNRSAQPFMTLTQKKKRAWVRQIPNQQSSR